MQNELEQSIIKYQISQKNMKNDSDRLQSEFRIVFYHLLAVFHIRNTEVILLNNDMGMKNNCERNRILEFTLY